MKELVKMMKHVKMIKVLILRLRSVSGSLENSVRSQSWSAFGYPELGQPYTTKKLRSS